MSASEASANAIYDRLADEQDYAVAITPDAQLKYRMVVGEVDSRSRVLEVGCAKGLHMLRLAPHCREVVGVDINDRMLAKAEQAIGAQGLGNAQVQRMNATDLGFPDASFDVVYSFSTLILVPEAELAVAEIARVLRPGGTAVLDITGRWNLSQRHWGAWYRSQGHPGVRSFTWPSARGLLDSVALDVVDAPAVGFLDQWRYLPVLRRAGFLDRVIHRPGERDLDFMVSNLRPLRRLANRWYVVCRKRG